MGDDKKTLMVLKVDLQCSCCYKKVKKVLCKFPQIRDQVYDEKAGTVTIMVTCCNPEKIRDKIYCKGGKTIKSIEIKDSSKPTKSDNTKVVEPKPPQTGKSENPKPPNSTPPTPQTGKTENSKPSNPAPQTGIINIIKMTGPVHGYPPQVSFDTCCGQCYNGMGGGPCYMGQGFGRPVLPPSGSCYDGYGYGGGNRGCYVSRCEYFSEENPAGCSIM